MCVVSEAAGAVQAASVVPHRARPALGCRLWIRPQVGQDLLDDWSDPRKIELPDQVKFE